MEMLTSEMGYCSIFDDCKHLEHHFIVDDSNGDVYLVQIEMGSGGLEL